MYNPPILPILHENFSIHDALQFNMAHNAAQPLYTFADSSVPSGIKVITHFEFGRAAHRVAHLLRPNRNGVDGEVVALILRADTVLYQALVAGLIVAGCVVNTLFFFFWLNILTDSCRIAFSCLTPQFYWSNN